MRRRNYNGARPTEIESWVAPNTGPNTALGTSLARLRARARDLVRNDPHAQRAVRVLVAQIVGTQGMRPRADTGDDRLDRLHDQVWADWESQACAIDETPWSGLVAQAVRAIVQDGETLARDRYRPSGFRAAGRPLVVPYQVQLLEVDHLDESRLTGLRSEQLVSHGVELDTDGRRLAYWLYQAHPGETWPVPGWTWGGLTSVRVPVEECAHVWESYACRPGQLRGVPWFTAILEQLRMLGDYEYAELVRKRLEACTVGVVETEEAMGPSAPAVGNEATEEGAVVEDLNGNVVEELRPGSFLRVRGGKRVTFHQPTTSADFTSFRDAILRAVAQGVGTTYESLSGDLSKVNFTSYRVGHVVNAAILSQFQRLCLVPMFCSPVHRSWLSQAIAAGRLPDDARLRRVQWDPPVTEAVDRKHDAEADALELRNGLSTYREVLARRGKNPDRVMVDIARTQATLAALGITLDSDPSATAGNGMEQMMPAEPSPDGDTAA